MSKSLVLVALAGITLAGTTLGCGKASNHGTEGITHMPVPKASKSGEQPNAVRLYSVETGLFAESPVVVRSDAEWKRRLTAQEYEVMRERGTEAAFTGKYWNHHADGTYTCAGCGADLFTSQTKFDSGCGWPSFSAPVDSLNVEFRPDSSLGMVRTEVLCRRCGAHLGHVFDDGPAPTGQRYCMNSVSLGFKSAGPDSAGSKP
jgi:peptide-methionine (R)-S-oxide reductase